MIKKIFLLPLFLFLSVSAFSAPKKNSSDFSRLIGFDVCISTALPIYGSSDVTSANARVNDGSYNRIVAGASGNAAFIFPKVLKLFIGTDTIFDFIWSGGDYCNHIDYAFYGGAKIYPYLAGFNFSLAYCFGCRTDFINNLVEDTVIKSSSWGNGFRLALEYDFFYGKKAKLSPVLGTYYRFMPRGDNSYDNIFAAYAGVSF